MFVWNQKTVPCHPVSPGTTTAVPRLWGWVYSLQRPILPGKHRRGICQPWLGLGEQTTFVTTIPGSSPRQWPSPISQNLAHRWVFVSICKTRHYHFSHLKPVHLLIALIQPTELPFGASYCEACSLIFVIPRECITAAFLFIQAHTAEIQQRGDWNTGL